MNEIIVTQLQNALYVIAPAIISLMAAIIAMYFNSLRRKVQENNGMAALDIFDTVVDNVVRALNQTVVRYTKKRGLGSLTPSAAKEIKAEAIKNIYNSLEEKTKKDIKYIVGDLDSYINTAIESKVKEQKNENRF